MIDTRAFGVVLRLQSLPPDHGAQHGCPMKHWASLAPKPDGCRDPGFIAFWQRWNHPHPRPELLGESEARL